MTKPTIESLFRSSMHVNGEEVSEHVVQAAAKAILERVGQPKCTFFSAYNEAMRAGIKEKHAERCTDRILQKMRRARLIRFISGEWKIAL